MLPGDPEGVRPAGGLPRRLTVLLRGSPGRGDYLDRPVEGFFSGSIGIALTAAPVAAIRFLPARHEHTVQKRLTASRLRVGSETPHPSQVIVARGPAGLPVAQRTRRETASPVAERVA